MKTLPVNIACYQRTPDFTEQSVPKALLRSHSTKTGTWGMIVVTEGSLTYRILEPDIEEIRLDPNHPGIIEPSIKHEIELHAEVKFYVQFYK